MLGLGMGIYSGGDIRLLSFEAKSIYMKMNSSIYRPTVLDSDLNPYFKPPPRGEERYGLTFPLNGTTRGPVRRFPEGIVRSKYLSLKFLHKTKVIRQKLYNGKY